MLSTNGEVKHQVTRGKGFCSPIVFCAVIITLVCLAYAHAVSEFAIDD